MIAELIKQPESTEAAPASRPTQETINLREVARHNRELFDAVRAIVLPGDSTTKDVLERVAEWRTALEEILSESYDGCQDPAPCLHCGAVNEKADYALRKLHENGKPYANLSDGPPR